MKTDTTATTAAPKFILHTKDEADKAVLLDHFSPTKYGRPVSLSGHDADTKNTLVAASVRKMKIISTGLFLEEAASLGAVTIVRAYDRTDPNTGTRNRGCRTPENFFAAKVKNADALAVLQAMPEYAAAFVGSSSSLLDDDQDGDASI